MVVKSLTIKSYAAKAQGQALEPYEYEAQPLGPWDVEVAITHCGICHSDLHLLTNDWGISNYPLIPGHEIIGHITEMGENITELSIGQRVGIGWQRSSCMHCEWCHQGEENLCLTQEATCVDHPGGFAEKIHADGRFAFPIPDALPSEQAAPLLCGGATVFSPFIQHKIMPTSRVGVIGIGGLGHLALQFANAFGCEVTAFSSHADKKDEALSLGAHHFISSTDSSALEAAVNTLDFIICTTMTPLNWEAYLAVLRPKGVLCFVGAQSSTIDVPFMSILVGRKSVCASNIASCPDIKAMLRFAADHKIRAQIELFPMNNLNQAIEKLKAGKVRYRAVLTNKH